MGTDHFGKHVTMDIGEHTSKYPDSRSKCMDDKINILLFILDKVN